LIGPYDNSIDGIKGDLDDVIALDEQIKDYAEKIISEAKENIAKAKTSGRKSKLRDQRRVAQNVKTQYDTANLLEQMAANVKTILDGTRGMPKDSTDLEKALTEVRQVYNRLVRLFRFESATLREIR